LITIESLAEQVFHAVISEFTLFTLCDRRLREFSQILSWVLSGGITCSRPAHCFRSPQRDLGFPQ
jgi:hypothetical protein